MVEMRPSRNHSGHDAATTQLFQRRDTQRSHCLRREEDGIHAGQIVGIDGNAHLRQSPPAEST